MAFVSEVMTRGVDDILHTMREADLSMPRLATLYFLRKKERASISQISEHLDLSLAATSSLVDQLVSHGYVTRTEDKGDRRHKQVVLTPEGHKIVEKVRHARVADMLRALEGVPLELRERLHAILRETLDALHTSEKLTVAS
jgi:DNA-binding MarR family transcriptional regulator